MNRHISASKFKHLRMTQFLLTLVLCILSQFAFSADHNPDVNPDLQESSYTPIRSLLSDQNASDRTIYIRGGRTDGNSVANQFIENITMDLLDDITNLNSIESTRYYNVSESFVTEINQYAMFDGEIREVNYIRRRKATGAVLNSVIDYFSTTPLYHNLKSVEDTISKYFFIEYSRGISSTKGSLYLPGQALPSKQNNDQLYKITLSTLFYSSTDTYKGYYSVELKFNYMLTEACTLYDFGKNEVKFRLKNEQLNRYLSSNWDFTAIHNNDEATTTFVLKMLLNY